MNPFTKVSDVVFDIDPKAEAEGRTAEDQPKKGDPKRIMTRSQLREFSLCPQKWLLAQDRESTAAMDFGSIVDCMLTCPHHFDRQFAVAPPVYATKGMKCPKCGSITDSQKCAKCKCERVEVTVEKEWNWNSTHCVEWKAAREAEGRICVKHDMHEEARKAVARFSGDTRLKEFVDASQRQAYALVNYTDAETGLVIPMRIIVDFVADPQHPKFGTCLGDLKTTDNAHPDTWARSVFQQGYHWQAALFLDAYNVAAGTDYRQFVHLLVESRDPFEPGRRYLSAEFVSLGRSQYIAALQRYCRCLASSEWPGYDDTGSAIDGWTVTDVEPWMILK